MTTREALHRLLEQLSDDEVEILAGLARERKLPGDVSAKSRAELARCIEARQYPVLTAVWDNDDDAVFDNL